MRVKDGSIVMEVDQFTINTPIIFKEHKMKVEAMQECKKGIEL